MWTGLHFEASFAGLVLNIVDSTPSGPSEMAAFSVDNFEVGKPSGTPGVTLSVWHFQVRRKTQTPELSWGFTRRGGRRSSAMSSKF